MQLAAQTMGSRLKLISSIGNGGFLEKHAKCLPAFSARIGPLFFFPPLIFFQKTSASAQHQVRQDTMAA